MEDPISSDDDGMLEKDQMEIDLERRLFGNETAFYDDIKPDEGVPTFNFKTPSSTTRILDEGSDDGSGLEELQDSDLFFLDSAPSQNGPIVTSRKTEHIRQPRHDEDVSDDSSVAWVDSDDDRLTVSLASNNRLRKLRVNETEDLISGTDYVERLRKQYEQLHPQPKWFAQAQARQRGVSRKRRKLHGTANDQEISDAEASSGSNSDMDIDEEDGEGRLSTRPLEDLLRSSDNLTRSSTSSTVQKIRPEIIDMHRLKDVNTSQESTISALSFHPTRALLLSSTHASCNLSIHHISPPSSTSSSSNINPTPALITTLHIRSTPLTSTSFLGPTGSKILFSGRRRYMHVWDLASGRVEKLSRPVGHITGPQTLTPSASSSSPAKIGSSSFNTTQRTFENFKPSPCGRYIALIGTARKGGGWINILSASTGHFLAEIRVEGRGGVGDFAWWADGEGIVAVGKGGEVVEWDGREGNVVRRWTDEGGVGVTVIAMGGRIGGDGKNRDLGGDRWLAIGSSSGIVNLYDRRTWVPFPGSSSSTTTITTSTSTIPETPTSHRPKHIRTFDQLTTPISHLQFSPTLSSSASSSDMLLSISSRWKKDALRLIHLPSATVFRNWPTAQTPLGRISAVAWGTSAGGEGALMLAVGNEAGKVRMWQVR